MRRAVELSALALLLLLGAAWAREHANKRLHVDYYYIPHCISCSRVLHGLESFGGEFGARVEVRTVDCFSDEGKAAASKYGFATHGIVVTDPDRGVLFEEKDHGVSAEDVRVVVRDELSKLAF